jgi:hypothetical protein
MVVARRRRVERALGGFDAASMHIAYHKSIYLL